MPPFGTRQFIDAQRQTYVGTLVALAEARGCEVIATGVETHSKLGGIEQGLHKVGEVLFGCLVGLCVSWAMAQVWPIKQPEDHSGP